MIKIEICFRMIYFWIKFAFGCRFKKILFLYFIITQKVIQYWFVSKKCNLTFSNKFLNLWWKTQFLIASKAMVIIFFKLHKRIECEKIFMYRNSHQFYNCIVVAYWHNLPEKKEERNSYLNLTDVKSSHLNVLKNFIYN